jgi:putative ABC transport system ATP-binding protein
MTAEALIRTRDLVKTYPMGESLIVALDRVSLDVSSGEFAGLVGPSGSGKTTLLNIVGTLDAPTSGSAVVLGNEVEGLDHRAAAEIRNRHIGFIFQTFNLLPMYTVFENVEFPLLLQKIPGQERRRRVMAALDRVGLADRSKSRPDQLSGGQCQRVAISRAVVKEPAIILADEPTANLDAENSHQVLRTMAALNQDLGTTFLFSTHDEKVVAYLRRRIVLRDGAVASDELVTPQRGEVP